MTLRHWNSGNGAPMAQTVCADDDGCPKGKTYGANAAPLGFSHWRANGAHGTLSAMVAQYRPPAQSEALKGVDFD